MPETFRTLQEYLWDMSNETTFADGIVLVASTLKYGKQIHVYHSPYMLAQLCEKELPDVNQNTIYLARVSVNIVYTGTDTSWINQTNDHYVSLQ